MILIETKVNGMNITANIREHSKIAQPQTISGRDGSFARLKGIGAASGTLDGENLHVLRVDVDEAYQGRGFGLALLQALLQKALQHGVSIDGTAFLIADEQETAGLQVYYAKMGFEDDPDYGATDHKQQHPMKAKVSVAITNIQNWRATRYSRDPAHIVSFS
ncbi:GNAT family N-acetyltransferase [Dyella choica]|uniref:GNAT family N-acetyltransferase n=1 Tax=Dyella choica TaxID=1927959 RepID=A0A3S0R1Y3_9GAMM|nr:GNAT family N-acetyltransferase [Dyella choica]RUL72498.1 GNAT family N-acetyltransferase [Dyella choica]